MDHRLRQNCLAAALVIACVGCRHEGEIVEAVAKPPKPVSLFTLQRTSPSINHVVTGSVVPWKTEKIAFEVAGRVAEVIEPNERVMPQVGRESSEPTHLATALARLDDEQLRIAVESARANVAVAKLNRDANLVTIEQQLPAMIESAEAEAELADIELARATKLLSQNAISRSELDAAQTRKSTTRARVVSAKADLAQAKARQLALEAQVLQAQQAFSEAERNLRNAILYSPFPGQVAQVHAVPGTYVKEGDPVVTVQMMDPMTIEFEVAAHDARRYHRGDMLPVRVTDGRGMDRSLSGMVYQVDAIADVAARTFTVTLHVRNEIDAAVIDQSDADDPLAWTNLITPLNLGPMVTGDQRLLVVREAVHTIGDKMFVWKVTNRRWGTPSPPGNRVLTVKRVPVQIISDVIPFLGKWEFVAIEFTDSTIDIDIDRDLITGQLYFRPPSESRSSGFPTHPSPSDLAMIENWTGNRVMLDDRRWLLRSGDVAQIALTPEETSDGFYVPMKAVRSEQGKNFVHVIQQIDQQATAKRVMVDVAEENSVVDASVLLSIKPQTENDLREGMQIVVEGTHYLNDGDRVMVSQITGTRQ
tara:strand:- start:216658 stop:218424 length:1767 start_codon:yes stop_codon:yes gene_type:complete